MPPLDARTRLWALGTALLCLLPLLPQLPLALALGTPVVLLAVAALSWRGPLPAWARAALAVLVVGGVMSAMQFSVGRDTGCALLAAMLAIKPSETATLRDARSLVGFALFAPFATFLLDQGPLSLALGLSSALAALVTLQRLSDLESQAPTATIPLGARMGSVLRLVALGLPLAMAAFWLFPRLASPLWGVPERALARTGLSDSMRPGEWIELLADDSPALRVRFLGPTPPRQAMYWRGPVLWTFDGTTWERLQWSIPRSAPPPPGAPRWRYEMELEPTESRRMVALELPIAAPAGTRLSPDGGLVADTPLMRITRWELDAAPASAAAGPLTRLERLAALQLPPGFNPRTVALGRQWGAQAGGDHAALVQRALAWIRADFAYTLSVPPLGRNAMDAFLFDVQQGFCEQFSSAFVVLMRAAGVPARVVTGYTGGYRNPLGDYWLVRQSDAHAWAEVWLAGRGWVRVDPTAAVAPDRIFDTIADRAPGADGPFGTDARALFDATDWLRRGWNDFVLGFDATRQQDLLRRLGAGRPDAATLGLLFALLAVAALAFMVAWSMRGERERDPVLRAWRRLTARYARVGLGPEPHEPALAWAERVSQDRPLAGRALVAVTQRFSDWRYAAAQPGNRDRAAQRTLVRVLRSHRPP